MYSIFFYYSFWIKVRQSFLWLFIRSNTMLKRSKSPICWSNVDCLLQNFAILWHVSISTVFHSSFIESLATEFVLVTLLIVATIGFATQAQHFWTSKLFSKESRLSLIMFLVGITARSGEKVVSCNRSEAVCTILQMLLVPFSSIFGKNNVLQFFLGQG